MHRGTPLITIAAASLLCACSGTRYLSDGTYLLGKVNVRVDGSAAGVNTSVMKSLVAQKGGKAKWIDRALKPKESAIVYDSALTANNVADLTQELRNEGFLGGAVTCENVASKRKISTTYVLHPGRPYRIGNVNYEIRDSVIASIPTITNESNRLIRNGMQFSIAALDEERKRITNYLNDHGYYRFNKEYITFEADTVRGGYAVDVTLVLHRYDASDKLKTDHPCYHIGEINYLTSRNDEGRSHIREKVKRANTFIERGRLYSNSDLRRTYNSFGRLQAVKYTDVDFRERAGDSLTLDCDITLTTNKPHSISFQPEGTNTAGDFGAAASLTYENRNLLHGSELLSLELRGAYEAIKGLEGYSNKNFVEYSAQASLSFPRFIAPFLSHSLRRRVNATSEASLLYDLQNRPEYHRRVLSLAWRYKWYDSNHHDRYQLDLLDLSYVFMPWISETFRRDYLEDNNSRNAILRYNYEDLFIMKSGLRFSYNNGRYAIKANVETAGNLLNLVSGTLGASTDDQGRRMLFKIAYAQYAKVDLEYTRNIQLGYDNQLVLHCGLGLAYPYGNSSILPFEKRYFSGGANSVRGWSVRELGPGRYRSKDGKIDFINQTGDMKLDVNIEYRTKLFWKFNGAAFVDAGNIWTLRDYADQPGGQFAFDSFWKEIAASYGLGLRLNFDFFILRFDCAMKAVNPVYDNSREHFPIAHPRMSRDFTFHFAVGLPF